MTSANDNRYLPGPDPSGAGDDAQWRAEVEQAIRDLRGTPLIASLLRVVDPTTLRQLLLFGDLGADLVHGLRVVNQNGRLMFELTSEHGQSFPRIPLVHCVNGFALDTGTQRPETASPSFVEMFRADFSSTGAFIDYDISIYPNGGVMSWRILVYQIGGPPGGVGPGESGQTVNGQRSATFAIPTTGLIAGAPDDPGALDPVGREMTLRLEIQRDAGPAPTVGVALNGPFRNYG